MIGPYKIKKLVSLSYQLELPASMKIHDIFYPSLLQKALDNLLLRQHNDLVPLVIINDKKE